MKKKIEAFVDTGFEFNGRKYKPLTAMGLLILEKVESPFYNGNDDGMRSVIDFLYVTDADNKPAELLQVSKSQDTWEEVVLEYADQFQASELKQLAKLVAESATKLTESMVEVEEGDDEGK